jgi:hypothetical protein
MTPPHGEWVVIRGYADAVAAELDRAVLAAHDLAAVVQRDDAGGMLPPLQEVRLAVPWEDALRALAILDQGAEPDAQAAG